MAFTGKLGVALARLKNVVPGYGSALAAALAPVQTTSPELIAEIAFANDPIETDGYYLTTLLDGPGGYWRLDDSLACADQSGGGQTMTLVGSPTLVSSLVSGDPNQATSFNGTSQAAVVASTATLSPTGPMSLEFFVKTPSSFPVSTKDFISKKGSFWCQFSSAGKLLFNVKKGATVTTVTSVATLSTSTTYYVECVYDGANLYIRINGSPDSSTVYSAGIDATNAPLLIARTDNSSTSPSYRSSTFRSSSLTFVKPAGTVDGDYLITSILTTPATTTINTLSGWTLLGVSNATANARLWTFGKVASGEPSSWTWSATGLFGDIATVAAYSGVGTTPVGSVLIPSPTGSGTTITSAARPTYDNTLLASVFAGSLSSTSGSWAESLGTERLDYDPTISLSMAINTLAVGASATQSNVGTSGVSGELHAATVELVGPLTSTYQAVTMDEVSVWNVGLSTASNAARWAQVAVAPPAIVWTDVSADVREASVTTGRQYELDRTEAGTARIVLEDVRRDYDPSNAASPYSPNVVPFRPVRLRAALNELSNHDFETDASGWTANAGATLSRDTITVHGGSGSLKVVTPGSVVDEGARSNDVIVTAGDEVRVSAWVNAPNASTLYLVVQERSTGTLVRSTTTNLTGTGGWQQVSSTVTTGTGIDSVDLLIATRSVAQAITFYADDAKLARVYPKFNGFAESWQSDWEDPDYAQTTIVCTDGFEPLALSLVTGSVPASQSGTTIGSLLGKIFWPGLNRSLDAGAFSIGAITLSATNVLDAVQTVAGGEDGIFFMDARGYAVFHDKNHRSTSPRSTTSQGVFSDSLSDGELSYVDLSPSYDTGRIYNDWQVHDAAGGVHQATDQSSIFRFFRRSNSKDTYLSSGDAASMASYFLARTSQPGYRFDRMVVQPVLTLPLWQQAFQREISDRISVRRRPATALGSGAPIQVDCWIEAKEWTITSDGNWSVAWQLSPAG